MQYFLSIVIPAYNEEKRINQSLDKVLNFMKSKKYTYEIIVVDDGSKDSTVKKVEEINRNNNEIKLLANTVNMGKGYSVKRGVLASQGKYIYFTDADMSTPIEEVDKFLSSIENSKADVVIGSRELRGSDIIIKQPFSRRLIGRVFNLLVKSVGLTEFMDTQCGAKMFKNESAQKIFSEQKTNSFAFDVEILYLATKNKYKIVEIPIKWLNSADSKVRAFQDSFSMFVDLIKIRIFHL